MKKIAITILVMVLTLSFSLFAQTDWEKYTENPVFDLGPPDSWDDYFIMTGSIYFDGTTYHLWYSGVESSEWLFDIGHATSPDGITWMRDTLNPVLESGSWGSWDDARVFAPKVFLVDSTFHMMYIGYDGTNERIGLATSSDGLTWTKDTLNPVLDLGPEGSWDDEHVSVCYVLFDGTIYHLWYSGGNGSTFRIGHATSSNVFSWTKDTLNPVLDKGPFGAWDWSRVQSPNIIYDGTTYQMWYSGGSLLNWRIGYATSPDGSSWTKDTLNPVLDVGEPGTWDDEFVSGGFVEFDESTSTYKMWYSGGDGSNSRIGYATSQSLSVTEVDNNLPVKFTLHQNYPNPFNPATILHYDLPNRSDLELTIFDILGREVKTLVHGVEEPGIKSVEWDGTNDLGEQVSTGVYLYQIRMGDFTQTRKMILLR